MGDDEEMTRLKMRAQTSQGYSVRQSEEALNSLEKENFNLKLKLFFLENKYGMSLTKPSLDSTSAQEKECFDLFIENESLKKELKEKQDIMKTALNAIEMLEEEKIVQEKKSKAIIEEQKNKIDSLKSRSKFVKTKKVIVNPSDEPKIKEDFQTLRSQNSELFSRINAFKKEVAAKSTIIEKLTTEKREINRELEMTKIKLKNSEKAMLDFREEVAKQTPKDAATLKSENDHLKLTIQELIEKCQKLEKKAKEFERLIGEQNSLMKALNRTIEVKNEELRDYKMRTNPGDSAYVVKPINLACDQGDTEKSNFPFHNPLFGEFSSKYR